jgi:hypothetical protein
MKTSVASSEAAMAHSTGSNSERGQDVRGRAGRGRRVARRIDERADPERERHAQRGRLRDGRRREHHAAQHDVHADEPEEQAREPARDDGVAEDRRCWPRGPGTWASGSGIAGASPRPPERPDEAPVDVLELGLSRMAPRRARQRDLVVAVEQQGAVGALEAVLDEVGHHDDGVPAFRRRAASL